MPFSSEFLDSGTTLALAVRAIRYLRITELCEKWNGSKIQNWAMVRNQLITNDIIKACIEKYEHMICQPFFQPRGYPFGWKTSTFELF